MPFDPNLIADFVRRRQKRRRKKAKSQKHLTPQEKKAMKEERAAMRKRTKAFFLVEALESEGETEIGVEVENGFKTAVAGFLPKDKAGLPFVSPIENKKRLVKVMSREFFELRPSD